MSEDIKDQLRRHEGLRLKPYRCPSGKLTIGYGRNLEDVGISEEEAEMMLQMDISRCRYECDRNIPCFRGLSLARQNVLINMCFNMGITKLLKFERTIDAIAMGHYGIAADCMRNSNWYKQVPERAEELCKIMEAQDV